MKMDVTIGKHAAMRERVLAFVRPPYTTRKIRNGILGLALLSTVLATVYWTLIASDRYVSEAHIMIQRTELPGVGATDLGGLLSGITNTGNRTDQLVLRDHLLSIDMLKKLDARLHLRAHYSDWHRDPLSRLWFRDEPIEKFHDYFLTRLRIDLDDYTGGLVVDAQAYDPKTAQAIVNTMVQEGEAFMNENDHRLVAAQVRFLEGEVERTHERNERARQAVLAFQNKAGLISPEDSVRQIAGIVAQLQSRRATLQTQLATLQSYLVPNHPDVVSLRQQIQAVEAQMANEQARITSPSGPSLNRTAERFQRLQQEASFSQALYQTTLAALEKGRIDAMRTVKKVSLLQSPTLPEYAAQPKRLYNSLVFGVLAFLLAGVTLLLIAIVRDHID